MSAAAPQFLGTHVAPETVATKADPSQSMWRMALRSGRVVAGGGVLLAIVLACVVTLPWTIRGQPAPYEQQTSDLVRKPPMKGTPAGWLGYDALGRSMLARCLLGGVISLGVGVAAATISVIVGVTVGLIAGYRGGWIDALLMRSVDILYGLPYILLVILFKIGFEGHLVALFKWIVEKTGWNFQPAYAANLIVLFSAIGLVSWLTMARVVRGQVLSLRSQPFVEACRAMGLPQRRIFLRHMLPNLVGPITVYATLTIPSAILQESFLSFLGVGVNPPMPTWGSLASDAVQALSPVQFYWWMLVFPCALLAITLLSLNFLGDGLRDVFDPKREAAKI
jgi:ABC-type dipeptide/oligopeptide/nickel transport system permease subunit